MPYWNSQNTDHQHSLISALVVRCLDSTTFIVAMITIARHLLASVSRPVWVTPGRIPQKTDFHVKWLNFTAITEASWTLYVSRGMTKPTKWVRPAKTQISLGIRPVWSESSLCTQWVAKDPSFLHADSEDSDQTGRMSRLIWVFAGRTVTLLVLSCRGSCVYVSNFKEVVNNETLWLFNRVARVVWWSCGRWKTNSNDNKGSGATDPVQYNSVCCECCGGRNAGWVKLYHKSTQ